MAKQARKPTPKKVGSPLLPVLFLLLLILMGWQLHTLQGQVAVAQAEHESYTRQVARLRQENSTLQADIAAGATTERMKELAREELGWVAPGEYIFYDRSN